ncbi:MAG: carbohydrate kinase family protein [Acidimicrobiales bacterium]
MSRQQVVVVGETAADVLVSCGSDGPAWGQAEVVVDDASVVLGSSGAITAAALAALSVPVAFVGVVGDDHLGALFLGELGRLGVDVGAVRRARGRRTALTVALERHGDRAMLTYPGTMADLTAGDVPASVLAGATHVHVSSYFLQRGLQPGLPALLEAARAAGATTSLDPGWDAASEWDAGIGKALRHVDWFLPNETEAAAIAARVSGSDTPADATAAAILLRRVGVAAVAVKRAGAGATLTTAGTTLELDTDPLVPVDTTGAGDNFDAGLIAGLLAGCDPAVALAMAVACGRHAVGGRGGTGRLASRCEAEDAAARLVTRVRRS